MMRRKHNPYVALAALLLLALIVTWICGGCCVRAGAAGNETNERFTIEYAGNECSIITDNETGVKYLFYSFGTTLNNRAGGLCKLEAE